MTPAARVQAAIDVLDDIQAGAPAERALTGWSRRSRFAGSKDRAAVRDHVFDVLRQKRSCAAVGGYATGRGLMIGLLHLQGTDLAAIFTGEGYAPAILSDAEHPKDIDAAAIRDLPEWLLPELEVSLGDKLAPVDAMLKQRAPVVLRVNFRKATRATAAATLETEGVHTHAHGASDTALIVTEGARRIQQSAAYKDGLVELQDSSSQLAIEALPLQDGMRVLDYCAGGGGKLLAMAGRINGQFFAHDAIPRRLKDLPERAKRAGIKAQILATDQIAPNGPYDLVFCDVPCSGSGSWRRDPDGKWRLTEAGFQDTLALQMQILSEASDHVATDGVLVYATCSLCRSENQTQVAQFLTETPGWSLVSQKQWTPLEDCDGFFTAILSKG